MNSWQLFFDNPGKPTLRWNHYFPIYDKHFTPWKNRTLTFLEVGVFNGGAGALWSKYFGTMATIVAIDINPACKQFETDYFQIRIGDQSDTAFLQSVLDEFGIPDIVLDDGSHQQDHIYSTFSYLYPKMHLNSIYMVEDLHTSYWPSHKGSLHDPNTFMNKTKAYLDQLNLKHCSDIVVDPIVRDTFCISCYDSIVVFEKGKVSRYGAVQSGRA